MDREREKYLRLLARQYPTQQAVCREIINLSAILNLPKGTEHFMSDLHGEYEAFYHILNNCSGVIKEKIEMLYGEEMTPAEINELCTLIYYPQEKMKRLEREGRLCEEWYRLVLNELITIARSLSSKYTRSKVRKAMPEEFSYIIDELLHMQKDEDDNQIRYHQNILEAILAISSADEFVVALAALIKRLAVDHLHIVGDIFDRGANADKILDLLMTHHSMDIEWGNHDILWMGAACGSAACAANVLRNNLRHGNTGILENGYGISLRHLTLFGLKTYGEPDPVRAACRAISVIAYKLEEAIISRHPGFAMDDRKWLSRTDWSTYTLEVDGERYPLNTHDFPTVDPADPAALTPEEAAIVEELTADFMHSARLQTHVQFLYDKGSMYRIFNSNLLYHGCVPMDAEGNFDGIILGNHIYKGRDYLDYADHIARRAYYREEEAGTGELSEEKHEKDLDFMWFLWAGPKSPLCGRRLKTFEREFIDDPAAWAEESDHYYSFYMQERYCNMILREFGLFSPHSHIVNGHTPVRTGKGETPVRANGRLYVIDGGFCNDMHKTTGTAGYTLIYNSHGIRLKAHHPFTSIEDALERNDDILSDSQMVESEGQRVLVADTDIGTRVSEQIADLKSLLALYRKGSL